MVETLSEPQVAQPLLLLSHLLRAGQVWLGRIQGLADVGLELWKTDSLMVCRDRIEANTESFANALAGLEPKALLQSVYYTNTKGTPFSTPLSGTLDHVFNHSTHHRGQVALLVRDAGQVPEPLDLIAYLRHS